ncbi:hypothetical protein G6N82_04680 [Altererythrobacter sp. BO-6]|uniref:hypothetical protein n=1 Tax=Altererythrobacter sp. BO-6 TaxID=2604537 RepID=UPI0013E130A8|nr:hypothetical protein [Altererythrobacter sp. BO-6]QIG53535.1 hypothetical protein G6N82_04680 [Altererythrobacter sp. BO-6]
MPAPQHDWIASLPSSFYQGGMPNFLIASLIVTSLATVASSDAPAAGVWTNTEDAYFAEEEGRQQPEWAGFEIGEDGRWRQIDAFGMPLGEWAEGSIPGVSRRESGGWQIGTSELRRARPFTCWMSVRKPQDKPDGSADWSFQSGLRTFDQGGRIAVGGGDAPEATIRLRNVTWAKGSRNAPSLVLYIHQDDPDRAVSYAWAAPDSGTDRNQSALDPGQLQRRLCGDGRH